MSSFGYLSDELSRLDQAGLLRRSEPVPPRDTLLACSNDYLGYAFDSKSRSGAGGSRLVVGDSPEHSELEAACAQWLRVESALVYSSGYAANVGLVSALAGEEDLVVSLQPNHASIIDGCRLSRARIEVAALGDMAFIRSALLSGARRRFLVCESYYSMDGLSPDLKALRGLCLEFGAVMVVDEAHALGVFGPEGRGLCAELGVEPDAIVGTFGKALGGQGAFVCGPGVLRSWLWNRSRSFVFSTGMSPDLCSALSRRVEQVRCDDPARLRLSELAAGFRRELQRRRVPVLPDSFGPIVPVIVGTAQAALSCEAALRRRGFFVRAIRPPTVPEGTARLRITVSAAHNAAALAEIAEVLGSCL